jgi:tetrahydromethanopterin S-methyltransferase subunit B
MTEQELEDLLELLAADISKTQSSIIDSEKKSQDAIFALESSIFSMTSTIKKILDGNAIVVAEKEAILQSSIAEDIERLTARIDDLHQSITNTNHEVKRYFDKEKYAITKGIVTQIIKEEKLHG